MVRTLPAWLISALLGRTAPHPCKHYNLPHTASSLCFSASQLFSTVQEITEPRHRLEGLGT